MIDKERIVVIIEQMRMYLSQIEQMNLKDMNDDIFDALSMRIFSLLNKTIDLAEEIVKGEELGMPMKTRDLFEFLKNKKIISVVLEGKLGDLIILRNAISHRYERVDKKQIVGIAKDLINVREFVDIVRKRYKL